MTRNPSTKPARLFGISLALLSFLGAGLSSAEVGETKVLKWKDGKKAVFLLSFDDSCPTHLTNVIPALEKRNIVGNFYVVPGGGPYKGKKAEWEKVAKIPVVSIQNHTFTHSGGKSVEQVDEEFSKCNDAIKALYPEKKWPRLLGWGKPGGVPWTVSKEDTDAMLKKNNLVERPPFWGPPIHQKTAAECIATIDKALEKGEMGHLDCHGVGGDWLVTPMDWFTAILDKLDAEKEQLWTTDVVSYSQYKTERETAETKVLQVVPKGIRLTLTSAADPVLYDLPLTLETSVPADWKECSVKQGTSEVTVPVKNGAIRFDAVPGKDEIRIVAK